MQRNSLIPGFIWNGSISGRAISIISFLAINKNVLQNLLPTGLFLADQSITAPDYHPVYFAFNLKQESVTTPIPGFKLNYSEFALGIPYTQLKQSGDQPSYAYSPVLYLNSFLGMLGGHIFYSLPKVLSKVVTNSTVAGDTDFTAARFFNHKNFYLQASFKDDGASMVALDCENFLAIKPMLTQSLIVHSQSKGFRTTDYDMRELLVSTIQPVKGELQTRNFITGLSHQAIYAESITSTPLGAFKIEYSWHLSKAIPVVK